MTKQFDLPQILLILVAFLTPLMGGHVITEAGALPGGLTLGTVVGGSDVPTLSHALLALFVTIALASLLLTRRVIQVPNTVLGTTVFIFVGVVFASTLVSKVKTISIPIALEWITYATAMFAVVGAAGRRTGPLAIVSALVAGCTVLAVFGLREYGDMRWVDRTWRVFPLWNNSNAYGVMLLIGFVLSLGLLMIAADRRLALAAGAATVLIAVGTLLSQSKGAVIIMPLGLIGVLAFRWVGGGQPDEKLEGVMAGPSSAAQTKKRDTVRVVSSCAVAAAMIFLVNRATPSQSGATSGSLSHLTDVAASSQQSAGFRFLMWKTSLALIQADPTGSGIGMFRYESARPGIATQTVMAHNAYLQLATEGSPVLAGILIVVVFLWMRLVFRGVRTLPHNSRILFGAATCAVLAVLGHCLIDSDLYYYGIGFSVFMLMGVSLVLSADSVAPEFLFPALRRTGATIAGLTLIALLYFGYTETLRAEARGARQAQDLPTTLQALDTLHSIAPTDGEAWFLTSQSTTDPNEQLQAAKKAVEYAPHIRNLRYLARVQAQAGDIGGALANLQRALRLDPNNLSTLELLADLQQKSGATKSYFETLRRMIAVEKTTYFTIRSLPELVPTETYEARLVLADASSDPSEKRKLLKEAVDGFKSYKQLTVPNVIRMAKSTPPMNYGGEDLIKAKAKMDKAADAAQRLEALDREAGDTAGATAAETDAAGFLAAVK